MDMMEHHICLILQNHCVALISIVHIIPFFRITALVLQNAEAAKTH